ncbi:MAG: hypothetical protein J0H23_02360 [Micrococcales bacterium]|nr:hypothetical protein [Micrococcales bacterium]OJX66481.1 MAG: hypothetical protein BGO94_06325 [Micrococcales bacterium 72-143]
MAEFTGAFPAPAWTPPAPEPFVPLRPLTLGQILAGSFRALRHNPGVTLVPAIVVSIVATLGGTAFGILVVEPLISAVGSGYGSVSLYGWVSGYAAGALGWVVTQSLGLGAGVAQQGVSAVDVAHAVIGRRLTPGGFRRRMRGVVAPLLVWTAIVVLLAVVGGLVAIAVMGLIATAGSAAAVLGGFIVYPAVAALLAWLGTKLAFVPSAIAVERLRIGGGIRRSWRLTRGQFWRSFGIRILSWGMIWIATMLVGIPVQLVVSWLAGIVAGNGDLGDHQAVTDAGAVVASIVAAVIAAIGLVVTTSVDALLYLDLRMRREGLDLELSRFMERRRPITRADPAEVDPYRPPAELASSRVRSAPDAGSPWA